jgi:hypothetical protein
VTVSGSDPTRPAHRARARAGARARERAACEGPGRSSTHVISTEVERSPPPREKHPSLRRILPLLLPPPLPPSLFVRNARGAFGDGRTQRKGAKAQRAPCRGGRRTERWQPASPADAPSSRAQAISLHVADSKAVRVRDLHSGERWREIVRRSRSGRGDRRRNACIHPQGTASGCGLCPQSSLDTRRCGARLPLRLCVFASLRCSGFECGRYSASSAGGATRSNR